MDYKWPNDTDFAFTIFDDTDWTTTENAAPVYDLLAQYGIRSTKSAWPTASRGHAKIRGSTCADATYVGWVLHLQDQGFEIAFHNATSSSSCREDTIKALDKFAEYFGHNPYSFANHTGCGDNIY